MMKETMIKEAAGVLTDKELEALIRAIRAAEDAERRAKKGTYRVFQVYTAEALDAAGINSEGKDHEELRATFCYDTDAELFAEMHSRLFGMPCRIYEAE